MKRITTILIAAVFAVLSVIPSVSSAAVTEIPELVAESAVLINADSGEVLYDKMKDVPLFPASTTKVMTCLLALENLSLQDTVVISHDASYTEGSRIYLIEGEIVTVEQLLYAMMLESANDAAIALAETIGGNVENFADMMNERAKELGAKNTNFVTPNGLPNDAHVTTAYDLAMITKAAMKNEMFRKIVSTYSYNIPPTNKQEETRYLHNTNRLLSDNSSVMVGNEMRIYKYDGILGVKTGYTNVAQNCLVAAAERDGVEIIGVILKSDPMNQYPDMIKLLDYGFANYTAVSILQAGEEAGSVPVKSGKTKNVKVAPVSDVKGVAEIMSDGSSFGPEAFTFEIIPEELTAPVEAGTPAGTLALYQGDRNVGNFELITMEAVELSFFGKLAGGEFSLPKIHAGVIIALIVIILAALYVITVLKIRRANKIAREKRKAEREQRRMKYEEEKNSDKDPYYDMIMHDRKITSSNVHKRKNDYDKWR